MWRQSAVPEGYGELDSELILCIQLAISSQLTSCDVAACKRQRPSEAARRARGGSGFNHFLDLIVVLAAKLHPHVEGAEAVNAVLAALQRV